MSTPRHTNRLIKETSPYLLQHAHNPVDWHSWNDKTLEKARTLDKMMIISIGYSSCHWCHVMERESFMDEEVAAFMNRHFICIKVDREERPDVDQVYMNAVQLISGSGGWPLNCFALPDGRPFFGGTYFRRNQWLQLLENITRLFEKRRGELEGQAESLTQGVKDSDRIYSPEQATSFSKEDADEYYSRLANKFDLKEGGTAGAPKFPMPVYYQFLLRYFYHTRRPEAGDFIRLSLRKMAFGGIYDQLGGGFSRYSTDNQWKIPHFEKMLYDNAQLVSVYADAYKQFGDPLYREVVDETMAFVRREMTNAEGGFYSALDADSEGLEGRYYTWEEKQIKEVLGNQGEIIKKYYHIGEKGLWESGRSILMRTLTADGFAGEQGLRLTSFRASLKDSRAKLLKARQKRIRPDLDNKVLASWNALMLKACVSAYTAFKKRPYLEMALKNAAFLTGKMIDNDGNVYHNYRNGKTTIPGFLEDHAFLAEAFLDLHEVTLDPAWLELAEGIANTAIKSFFDETSGLFFFSPVEEATLIARKKDIYDNVVPSTNSSMAIVLNKLGALLDRDDYRDMSQKMLATVASEMIKYPGAFTNWATLLVDDAYGQYVVAITGPDAVRTALDWKTHYLPGTLLTGSVGQSPLPYLKDRFVPGRTFIYVCKQGSCLLPTESLEDALRTIEG